MTTPTRFAAAALIGVLAVGGAFLVLGRPGQPAVSTQGTSPAASPSASPSAVPNSSQTYTSARAGYSIIYPKGWTATPAAKPCEPGCDTEGSSDLIQGDGSTFYGTSMKLPQGTSFSTWFATYDADRSGTTCGASSLNESITVDGAVGHLDVHCSTWYLEAVVPKDDRAYVFTMFTPFTRTQFESLLDTVRLTPETAKD